MKEHSAHAEDHSAGHGHGITGARQRGRRAWPQWAGVLAVTAGIVMLAAACSSSPSSASSMDVSSQLQQNPRHYVPVTTGIFDDGDGLVQVTGALTPGQHVVVPAT